MPSVDKKLIYLDNAATSFPKPESVYEAMLRTIREEGGNSGRSGHKLSLSAGKIISEARFLCARLFHSEAPENIVFTANTTLALNIAIKGVVKPGDHIITSSLEHNSVSRPLHYLERSGVTVTKLPTDLNTGLNINDIKVAIRSNTKLVVCTHVSNVTGTVNDIASIGTLCRDNGILFLVDAAQSAGSKAINVRNMCIDMLAFPGHKSLFGPQGTGGLYIRSGLEVETIIQGGTGSKSDSPEQPEHMPDKFESGTLNTPGLAGLAAGVHFIMDIGIEEIERRETLLTTRLIQGVGTINGIRLIGPDENQIRGNVVSVCVENTHSADAALMMDSAYHVAVRGGLHCASDAHRAIGTIESGGTMRISPNYFNDENDIEDCLTALDDCVKWLRGG